MIVELILRQPNLGAILLYHWATTLLLEEQFESFSARSNRNEIYTTPRNNKGSRINNSQGNFFPETGWSLRGLFGGPVRRALHLLYNMPYSQYIVFHLHSTERTDGRPASANSPLKRKNEQPSPYYRLIYILGVIICGPERRRSLNSI